jgi:hypothetical protein
LFFKKTLYIIILNIYKNKNTNKIKYNEERIYEEPAPLPLTMPLQYRSIGPYLQCQNQPVTVTPINLSRINKYY